MILLQVVQVGTNVTMDRNVFRDQTFVGVNETANEVRNVLRKDAETNVTNNLIVPFMNFAKIIFVSKYPAEIMRTVMKMLNVMMNSVTL